MNETKSLKKQYADICNRYSDALNKMWDTDGDWIRDDFQTYEVADCYIDNHTLRVCVDLNVDFDVFYDWYHYDLCIHCGQILGKKDAIAINLYHWLMGFPEDGKVPRETLAE